MSQSADVIEIRYDEIEDSRKVVVTFNCPAKILRWRYMLGKALESFEAGRAVEHVDMVLDANLGQES